MEVALKHGVDIRIQRQRLFKYEDFSLFDKIYVMDSNNFSDVASMAQRNSDLNNVDFLSNLIYPGQNKAIPDPYYGGKEGFENVYRMIDECCDELVKKIKLHQF